MVSDLDRAVLVVGKLRFESCFRRGAVVSATIVAMKSGGQRMRKHYSAFFFCLLTAVAARADGGTIALLIVYMSRLKDEPADQ